MDVVIDGKVYFSKNHKIMVKLTEYDRKNILTMPKDHTKYAVFPDDTKDDEIEPWFVESSKKLEEGPEKDKQKDA